MGILGRVLCSYISSGGVRTIGFALEARELASGISFQSYSDTAGSAIDHQLLNVVEFIWLIWMRGCLQMCDGLGEAIGSPAHGKG